LFARLFLHRIYRAQLERIFNFYSGAEEELERLVREKGHFSVLN
jgi:hypothetical protein